MPVVPKSWMPACEMTRIIAHWTGGGYKASSLDRQHYHILIESNGDLVRGFHEISDNVATGDGDYAAHTLGANTRSIGISACCMAGAKGTDFGKYPMTEAQWLRMAEVAADLAEFYDIDVAPETVLGHGEVQAILGKPQKGKWDPMVLPWQPKLGKAKVGDLFRSKVKDYQGKVSIVASLGMDGEAFPVATALINGAQLRTAVFANEDVLLSVAELGAAPGWTLTEGQDGAISASVGKRSFALEADRLALNGSLDEEAFISARDLALALDAKLSFDPDRKVVGLTWA